jgi:hypothetical protein
MKQVVTKKTRVLSEGDQLGNKGKKKPEKKLKSTVGKASRLISSVARIQLSFSCPEGKARRLTYLEAAPSGHLFSS